MVDFVEEEFIYVRQLELKTGCLYCEQWRDKQGLLHNTFGPAAIWYDVNTGHPVQKDWRRHGQPFRLPYGLPSTEEYDAQTGALTAQFFYDEEGQPREDIPFKVSWDPVTGQKLKEIFWLESGHREEALVAEEALGLEFPDPSGSM